MPPPLADEDALCAPSRSKAQPDPDDATAVPNGSTSDEVPVSLLGIEEALDNIPVGPFHYRLIIMTGLAFMADAMEVGLLSFVATCAGVEWNLNFTQVASISSAVFFGELGGGCILGPLADMYGRRFSFLVAVALISFGGIASGFAPNLAVLIVFRMVVGAGVGGLTVPFDLLAEFVPNADRGQVLLIIEFFWTLGSLFVAGMAWAFMGDIGWRGLCIITALPVILTSAVSYYLLPESPRWLLEQSRVREAEEVIRTAACINGTPLPPFRLAHQAKAPDEPVPFTSILKTLLDKSNRNKTMELWTVWVVFGFSYYGVILFVPRVLTREDSDEDEPTCVFDYDDIFINASFEVVGLVVATMTIDRLGRVGTQVAAYLTTALGAVFMGLNLSRISVLGFGMVARAGAMGASSATWVHTPELYGTELRATAHGVSNTVARLGALLSPYLVSSSLPLATIGVILGATSAVGAAAAACLPETAGKALGEASRGLGDDGPRARNRAGSGESSSSLSTTSSMASCARSTDSSYVSVDSFGSKA